MKEQLSHATIQMRVAICEHLVRGSNRVASGNYA